MHGTAERLEVAEAILHRSAEESPDPGTTARLHALGDRVTAQAQDVDRRADRLTREAQRPRQPETAAERERSRRKATADGERPGRAGTDRRSASPR